MSGSDPTDDASVQPLRVLLVSPVRGVDPLSGDVTYSEQLLSSPPPGVTYTTYVQAIEAGTLVEVGSRRALREASPRQRAKQLPVALWRKFESLVRRSGLAYREPVRLFAVKEGAFDLIHVHVFHSRFFGAHPPVVMSAGGPLRWVYSDAWGWSERRVAIAEAFDRAAGVLWDATICGIRRGRADRFIAFSQDFKDWLCGRGWPTDLIDVSPNFLSFPRAEAREPRVPDRLGFIAKDFDAKGGAVVLSAFATLRRRHPELELLIVGSQPRGSQAELAAQGITWRSLIPRAELLTDILPAIDILVYPTRCDTSVPYGPMEALASGIPCVVSGHRALPELVGDEAGRVANAADPQSVAAAVEALLDPAEWKRASDAALQRFRRCFSAETQTVVLGTSYRRAVLAHDERASHR